MAKVNRTKYAILGLLSFQPLSGYDIRKNIEKSIGYFWSENYSQIYPNLKALAQEGLATVSVTETEGKPDRKVYSITPDGLAELRQWLMLPPEPEVRRFELLLKLFFGHQIDSKILEDFVIEYKNQHQTMLDELEEIENLLLSIEHPSIEQTYQLMTVRYGISVAKALTDWCAQCLETFEEMHVNINEE
jgi:PadR family transcriptional regulator AphA